MAKPKGTKRKRRPAFAITELAKLLGVSDRTVTKYLNQGMPEDHEQAVAWVQQYRGLVQGNQWNKTGVVTESNGSELSLKAQALELDNEFKQIRNERLRIARDKDLGRVVVLSEVVNVLIQFMVTARAIAENLPERIGTLIADDDLRDLIKREVRDIVENFLDTLAKGVEEVNSSEKARPVPPRQRRNAREGVRASAATKPTTD